MRRLLISVVVTAHLLLVSTLMAAQDTVTIETGKLKGAVVEGVVSFKGIPYSAPPVGSLRWQPPQPAEKWSGIRQANAYGHDCMQLPFPERCRATGNNSF